ncbi:unnamed protein product [Clonostachys rosea]|uniref:F-box domain-containing protein n=1 Tax=Bionectria ochroleuca TaxID=29856 RepID=A0ABY6TX92_BIOOC|nr:unnamed protein product [Clonostachys rosea]
MAIALTTLPTEVLYTICECFNSRLDVASFRLVCRAFGDIGLRFLVPMVTIAPTAESIARLRAISLHPVLRHHVAGITFLVNVFYPDAGYNSWVGRVPRPRNSRDPGGIGVPDWAMYNKLLLEQQEAFNALGPGQSVEQAFRRLTNLDHLIIAESFNEDYLRRNKTYKTFLHRFPGYDVCEGQPFYPFSAASSYTGLPGVKPLKAFLRAMGGSKVRKLLIDTLDVGFFDVREAWDDTNMREGLSDVRVIELCLCVDGDRQAQSMAEAKRILSTDRLKEFLCSAPRLEEIHISFDWILSTTGYFDVKLANALPTQHTWSHLQSLQIDSFEIMTYHFLDFVSSHRDTLKSIGLKTCLLVNDPDRGPVTRRSCWSDVFVPLVTSVNLDSLHLFGRFRNSKLGDQGGGPDAQAGCFSVEDMLEDMDITVAQAVSMAICSREYDSFLRGELEGREDLTPEDVKKALVEDLTGEPQERSSSARGRVPVKRYSNYLKPFAMRREAYNWEPWWRREDELISDVWIYGLAHMASEQ